MVKLDTLTATLKSQGSVKNLEKSNRLQETLLSKIKLDNVGNPLLKFNIDLIILVGRFCVSKFPQESEDYKKELILKIMVALCSANPNGSPIAISDADKKIMAYVIDTLIKGDFIQPLSTMEMCFQYLTDFLRRLI